MINSELLVTLHSTFAQKSSACISPPQRKPLLVSASTIGAHFVGIVCLLRWVSPASVTFSSSTENRSAADSPALVASPHVTALVKTCQINPYLQKNSMTLPTPPAGASTVGYLRPSASWCLHQPECASDCYLQSLSATSIPCASIKGPRLLDGSSASGLDCYKGIRL